MATKLNLGIVRFTDRGNWVKGYSFTSEVSGEKVTGYLINDIVHTSKGIYGSLVNNNTSDPDSDTTGKWRTWLSLLQELAAEAAEAQRQKNETARQDAETAREKAESDRKNAESLRQQNATDYTTHESDREQAETERKAAEKQRETDFQTLSDGNVAQLAELKRLADSIQNSQSVAPMASVPASIFVETERTANVGETVNVAPTMFAPSTCNHSVIYQVYSGNAKVNYKGDVILPAEAGDVVIEVIPTLNNGATRVVTIHAVEPTPILDLAGEQITDEKGEAITA